jgi:hypothetical protein
MNAGHRFKASVLAALLIVCAAVPSCTDRPSRVLFIGNSLTYVGNLPKVLEAVCDASGTKCEAEMIVEGGATLTQRVHDNSIEMATKVGGPFEFVLLQERGGDYLYVSSRPETTTQAQNATAALVSKAATHGMKPILLGTYQGSPGVSKSLVAAEAKLAAKLNVSHVPISNHLQCGRQRHPTLQWMDADGMHPGPALTLLMAMLIQRELFTKLPPSTQISVHGAIYGPMNSPRATDVASRQPVRQDIVRTVTYEEETVTAVLQIIQTPCL